MNFSDSFDTTSALAALYLWLLFGMSSQLINCDIQRIINHHPLILHVFSLTAFFFLFTLFDKSNQTSVLDIFVKTFLVYLLFVMMTKSKWYFVIPVLLLLLIDQVMKKDVAIHLANATGNSNIDFIVERQKRVTAAINVLIVVLAVTGMMQYMCLNYMRHNERFSFHRFMLGINRKCDIRRL